MKEVITLSYNYWINLHSTKAVIYLLYLVPIILNLAYLFKCTARVADFMGAFFRTSYSNRKYSTLNSRLLEFLCIKCNLLFLSSIYNRRHTHVRANTHIFEHRKQKYSLFGKQWFACAQPSSNILLSEERTWCKGGHQRVFGAWVTGPASAIRPSGPHIHHWPMAWCSPAFVKTPRGNGVSGPDKNKISLMTKFLLRSQRE